MLIIKNGHIVDPMNKTDGVFDIAAEGAVIREIGKDLPCTAKDSSTITPMCSPWRRSACLRKPAALLPE